jgi:arabinofuranosyltransferase
VRAGVRQLWIVLGFVLLWLPYAGLVRHFWFLCDDAYISFRYSRYWADGQGLRFNLGDHLPVEGYSNFLWVAACAAARKLGVEITTAAPWLSFALGTVLLLWLYRSLLSQTSVGVAFLATLSLACFPPFAMWSTSGLETMGYALFFFATFDRLILCRGGVQGVSGGLCGLALALLRVEGIVWALGMAGLAVISRWWARQPAVRGLLCYLAVVAVGYGIYWYSRFQYFQDPVANTVHAKVGFSAETLRRGASYVALFTLTFLTPLLVFLTAFPALQKRRRAVGAAVLLMTLLVPAYATVVGGDFMAMGRLLIPGLAFQVVLLAWTLMKVSSLRWVGWPLASVLAFAVTTLGLLPGFDHHLVSVEVRKRYEIRYNSKAFRSEVEQWRFMKSNTDARLLTAQWLHEFTKPGESLVCGAIGVIGYYTDLFIYDQYGLVTREVSTRAGKRKNRSPGHEKAVKPIFFLNQKPTYLFARAYETHSVLGTACKRTDKWRNDSLNKQYVADFFYVPPSTDEDKRTGFLLLHRALREGEDPEQVWDEVYARMRSPFP